MPAGNALIDVQEGQPNLTRETDVLVCGIVQRAVNVGGELEVRQGVTALRTLGIRTS